MSFRAQLGSKAAGDHVIDGSECQGRFALCPLPELPMPSRSFSGALLRRDQQRDLGRLQLRPAQARGELFGGGRGMKCKGYMLSR